MRTELEYQRRIDHYNSEAKFYNHMAKFFGAAYIVFIFGLALTAILIGWATL